jgi:hypothetical protein
MGVEVRILTHASSAARQVLDSLIEAREEVNRYRPTLRSRLWTDRGRPPHEKARLYHTITRSEHDRTVQPHDECTTCQP